MHGGSMDRQPTRKWASVGKLIAAHEFCLWLWQLRHVPDLARIIHECRLINHHADNKKGATMNRNPLDYMVRPGELEPGAHGLKVRSKNLSFSLP